MAYTYTDLSVEPPIGTVAVFNGRFTSGGGYSSNMLVRMDDGWGSDITNRRPDELRTWKQLADVQTRNAEHTVLYPNASTRVESIECTIVAGPTTAADSARADMTVPEAACALGVSRPTLMKLVEHGRLASHKVGAHHRFTPADVDELAAARGTDRSAAFAELRELDEAFEELAE